MSWLKTHWYYIVIVLAVITGGAVLVMRKSAHTPSPQFQISNTTSYDSVKPDNDIPSPKEGFKQYINNDLRYGFSYPDTETLYECPRVPPPYVPCLSIEKISLRVEPLGPDIVSPDAQNSLLNVDLFCNADGARGTVSCKNTKVEKYSNSLGTEGYKVFRIKTITGYDNNIPAGEYTEAVYVLLLSGIRETGERDYAGMLFSVDNPSDTNQASLQAMTDSFFTYSDDNIGDWKTYRNEELGIEFQYPSYLEVQTYFKNNEEVNERGEEGKRFIITFFSESNNVITFSGIGPTYLAPREGSFSDSQGYEERDGQYYFRFIQDELRPIEPIQTLETFIGKILIVDEDSFIEERDSASGPTLNPGKRNLGALINLSGQNTFRGFSVLKRGSEISDEIFFQTLNTIKQI
ncbi:MAG: hypothetical protein A2705_04630 [Omnitrophica WOR_2 bacterium RIFCSPHIGHO2_01_FULL_52_10]|nr:MAG: hypothetical protein A2705_04630 [Omnitrophica WOR_2 bacterium RIFCSPHIGHO2_01_FULL_52_10]